MCDVAFSLLLEQSQHVYLAAAAAGALGEGALQFEDLNRALQDALDEPLQAQTGAPGDSARSDEQAELRAVLGLAS